MSFIFFRSFWNEFVRVPHISPASQVSTSTISQSLVPTITHMNIPEPPLSPSEIATTIYDCGHVRDGGSAQRLEQRVVAYGAAKGTEAHTQGLVKAAHAAHNALTGIRGANNRAAAARIVRVIESLLADDAKSKEGCALGYKDSAENKLKKAKREDTALRARQLRRV